MNRALFWNPFYGDTTQHETAQARLLPCLPASSSPGSPERGAARLASLPAPPLTCFHFSSPGGKQRSMAPHTLRYPQRLCCCEARVRLQAPRTGATYVNGAQSDLHAVVIADTYTNRWVQDLDDWEDWGPGGVYGWNMSAAFDYSTGGDVEPFSSPYAPQDVRCRYDQAEGVLRLSLPSS